MVNPHPPNWRTLAFPVGGSRRPKTNGKQYTVLCKNAEGCLVDGFLGVHSLWERYGEWRIKTQINKLNDFRRDQGLWRLTRTWRERDPGGDIR